MARIYMCDRCKTKFGIWSTTFVKLPACSFFGNNINADLCAPCLEALRALFRNFMDFVEKK